MTLRERFGYSIQVLCAILGWALSGMFLGSIFGTESEGWPLGWPLILLFGGWVGFKCGEYIVNYIDSVYSDPGR